jgi:hypothetical protein
MMMGHRSRKALRSLREFSIDDSQCYSAEDRAALTAVICSWYTDHQAGEDDPERLQALGKYKFETFVRHHLAPSIERQEAGEALRVGFAAAATSAGPCMLMLLSAADSAVGHVCVTLLYLTVMTTFIIPVMSLVYDASTSTTLGVIQDVLPRISSPRTALRKLLTAAAYLAGFVATAAFFPLFSPVLAPVRPTKFLAPEWRIPIDDGFDEQTRRFVKHWIVFSYYVLGMIVSHAGGRVACMWGVW